MDARPSICAAHAQAEPTTSGVAPKPLPTPPETGPGPRHGGKPGAQQQPDEVSTSPTGPIEGQGILTGGSYSVVVGGSVGRSAGPSVGRLASPWFPPGTSGFRVGSGRVGSAAGRSVGR